MYSLCNAQYLKLLQSTNYWENYKTVPNSNDNIKSSFNQLSIALLHIIILKNKKKQYK